MRELYELYENLNEYIKKYDVTIDKLDNRYIDIVAQKNLFDISFDISNDKGVISIFTHKYPDGVATKNKVFEITNDSEYTLLIYDTYISNYLSGFRTHNQGNKTYGKLLKRNIMISDIHTIVYYVLQSIYDISTNINKLYDSILNDKIDLSPIHEKIRNNDKFNEQKSV